MNRATGGPVWSTIRTMWHDGTTWCDTTQMATIATLQNPPPGLAKARSRQSARSTTAAPGRPVGSIIAHTVHNRGCRAARSHMFAQEKADAVHQLSRISRTSGGRRCFHVPLPHQGMSLRIVSPVQPVRFGRFRQVLTILHRAVSPSVSKPPED